MPRTHLFNAFAATLTNPITAGQTTIALSSVVGLQAPGKLVIDHADDTKREWIAYTGISGSSITGVTRGLAGSSGAGGATTHVQGAVVQSVPMHQHFDELWDGVEAGDAALATHAAAANPHPTYATDADLATTNATVATHTTQIAGLTATDVTHGADIDALEAADLAHFGSTTGHPVATTVDPGFQSAADKDKQNRFGIGCKVSTSILQNLTVGSHQFLAFDIDTYDPDDFHSPAGGSLFVIRKTGFYVAKFRNPALTAQRRTVGLREGGTPGTGNLYVMANGTFDIDVTSEAGRNTWVLGPEYFNVDQQLHLELGDQAGGSSIVAALSYFVLTFLGP